MQKINRVRTAAVAGLLALGAAFGTSAPALAYSPGASNLYASNNTSSCNKNPCILYPKSAELPSGRLVAAFEDSEGPVVGQTMPIYKSDDNGDTWQKLSDLKAPAYLSSSSEWAGFTSSWTNPYFYVLPQALGGYAKGTLLLANVVSSGRSGSNDRIKDAIALYASTDQGATWSLASKIAASPTSYSNVSGETVYQDPVWEPYLMMYGNQLVAYYSDENDYLSYNTSTGVPTIDPNNTSATDSGGQVLVHKTWSGSGTWSSPVIDVSGLTTDQGGGKSEIGGGRPGMTNVAPTTDGKWMLTYEYFGGGDNVHYKIASDPTKFYAVGGAAGSNISSLPAAGGGRPLTTGGSPVLISRPDGGLVYNAYGSSNIWVNESGSSTGSWKEYQTAMPAGYSRNLQYVSKTGLLQILQAPWGSGPGTGPVTSGQVDLGHSVGTYSTIVNRQTGQVLATVQSKTQDVNLTGDQPDIITWNNEATNDTQKWHAVSKGGNVTFLNKGGGRALGIYTGKASAGQNVVQWVDDNAADKQWKLIATTDGYVRIQSVLDPSYYMTAATNGGAVVLQTAQNPSTAQEWKLVQQ